MPFCEHNNYTNLVKAQVPSSCCVEALSPLEICLATNRKLAFFVRGFGRAFFVFRRVKMSKILGARLRECRKKLGLTQLEVANHLNLERSAYTFYETGKSEPPLKTLYKLTQLYGVSADELIKPLTK